MLHCYFTHEHGWYPRNYEPALVYTAWKTLDNSTTHKRQNESNEEFKVFALPLHKYKRFVVVVIHMHVSQPIRFTARHHTAIFAVLDKNWNVEMELHFKMDFGFAHGTSQEGGRVPFNSLQSAIKTELEQKHSFAGRCFNMPNTDDGYPETVNTNFKIGSRCHPNHIKQGGHSSRGLRAMDRPAQHML